MRIVGGRFKGRKLIAPEGIETRPTSDRARESIFNILEHQTWGRTALRNQDCLDVFAGSGAMGLEAFSRGAKTVTFIENSQAALSCLKKNAQNMASPDELIIRKQDIHNMPATMQPVALVFMDAPYKTPLTDQALLQLDKQGWISEETLLVIEVSSKEKWQAPFEVIELDQRKYGAAQFFFLKKKTV